MAEYAQSDEEGTDEDSDQECIQDSSDSSEENWNNHRIESGMNIFVISYAKSDQRGTGEASGEDDMQSLSDKWSPPSVEDYAIGNIQ